MKKGVTIKDIANKLNMSVSTVSKALNNDKFISSLTKERVQNLAKKWNYIPNEAARNFKYNKSFTIGLVIPDLMDQFYGLAIRGVEETAAQHKYQVIISQSYEDSKKEEDIIKNMIRNRVDGVIIAISKNTEKTELFLQLQQIGIPVVFLSRSISEPLFNAVVADNMHAGELAIDYLYNMGHRRIAHLMGPHMLKTSMLRLEGYKKALQKRKIKFDPELVKEVDFSEEQTYNAMHKLLSLQAPPTAVFTFKNYLSLDIITYLKQYKKSLINNFSIIGFGNLPLIKYLETKPVASIDENSYEMGAKAASLLLEHITNDSENIIPAVSVKIPCKLILHNS